MSTSEASTAGNGLRRASLKVTLAPFVIVPVAPGSTVTVIRIAALAPALIQPMSVAVTTPRLSPQVPVAGATIAHET